MKLCNQVDCLLLKNKKLMINDLDGKLEGDIFIQEKFQRTVVQQQTPIGIIGYKFSATYWQIKALGSVQWIVSDKNQPSRNKTDPPWDQNMSQIINYDIQVILLQGPWDLVTDKF